MEPFCVLVAVEPRTYRDVLAGALRLLRPRWSVLAVEPDELPAHLGRCAHEVVVASRLGAELRRRAFGWVLLYPDYENRATIGFAGHETAVDDLDFDALLGVLDRAEAVALLADRPTASPVHEQPGSP